MNTARDGTPSDDARKALHQNLERVRRCRSAIETQFPGAVVRGFSQNDVDQLRVALHSAQKGLEDIADQTEDPDWVRSLPDEIAWSISNTLHALAAALRDDVDEESRDAVARKLGYSAATYTKRSTQATKTGTAPFPPETLLASLSLLAGGEVVAQSVTQARKLAATAPAAVSAALPADSVGAAQADTSSPPDSPSLSPTMALAIQAVVAAVAAGLIAKAVGNEQSLVVAWTAFVVIAGSAGLSTRRAWVRLPATILGAVGGVAIAAFVPDNVFWTVAVVAVGVFFTIVTAPVSYPAMVFWMSIAFVPLFATEGRYLDLIRDKTVAALIGGCVAAVVALTIVPIRTSREIRPAVLAYLDALDEALESHLPGRGKTPQRPKPNLIVPMRHWLPQPHRPRTRPTSSRSRNASPIRKPSSLMPCTRRICVSLRCCPTPHKSCTAGRTAASRPVSTDCATPLRPRRRWPGATGRWRRNPGRRTRTKQPRGHTPSP